MEALSSEDPVELLEASVMVTSQLATATSDRITSLLPSDIQTTNAILDQVINILVENPGTMAVNGTVEVKCCCVECVALGLYFLARIL